jgi:hypothetical protein
MASEEKEYQRLPGRGMRREGTVVAASHSFCTLWLGRDHLLCIESQGGYTESYKRFYYRDIQAIVVRRTSTYRNWNIALGSLTGFFLLLTVVSGAEVLAWVFGTVAACLLAGWLLHAWRGPTCKCQLQTAVQTDDLPSLTRLRTADRVLDRLRPLIEATQGPVPPGEGKLLLGQATVLAPPPGVGVPMGLRPPPPRVVSHYRSRAHQILFWCCLTDVPATLLSLVFQEDWPESIGSALMLATMGVAVFALVKQHRTDLPGFLRALPVVVVVLSMIYFALSFFVGIYLAMAGGGVATVKADAMANPLVVGMVVTSTTFNALIGVLGLSRLRRFGRESAQPPPLPPVRPADAP